MNNHESHDMCNILKEYLTHHKKLYSNYSFGYDYTIDKLANTYLET